MTREGHRRIEHLKKRGEQNQLKKKPETLHGFNDELSTTYGEVGIRI